MDSFSGGMPLGGTPPGGIPGPLGALGAPKKQVSIAQQLADVMQSLPVAEQQSVLDFAEFLHSKLPEDARIGAAVKVYQAIPRPDEETVIAAIRRLSKTYPMLDRQVLFDQTSAAMSSHILGDVSSKDSIDRLEASFAKAYEDFQSKA